jgi:hypothetical protein
MVGNFFMLTCPYLLKQESIAYFAVLRHYHSYQAFSPISETTQILIDVYHYGGKTYLHPRKVVGRFAATIHILHECHGEELHPITQSSIVSDVLTSVPWPGMETPSYQVGIWNRAFFQAEEVQDSLQKGECSPNRAREVFKRLLRMVIAREGETLALAEKYLTIADLLGIHRRMIGTGYLGGKSVGMLLARAILCHDNPSWKDKLEAHDSFYVASEVFYTYLIQNDCWWIRKEQKDSSSILAHADMARQRILQGKFPDYVVRRFEYMLDYFGQSPIIVRSSSLLEDNFGNMFAGKYESVFCASQGPREERLEQFMQAVRIVYASSMSQEALLYRAQHGVLDQDEQMALLVQRVSGGEYGRRFFPQISGVAFSHNPYVWTSAIDPRAGVVRIVFGLGTRAVNTHDDDYTRLVALNAPHLRPECGMNEVRRYTQRKIDVLDLRNQMLRSVSFDEIQEEPGLPLELFSQWDYEMEQFSRERGLTHHPSGYLSFDTLFNQTEFLNDLRQMLSTLERCYGHSVDIEFTANFLNTGAPVSNGQSYRINLLQCRPFQFKGVGEVDPRPPQVESQQILVEGSGSVVGTSRSVPIDQILFVDPAVYGNLPIQERYSIARLIGRLTHLAGVSPTFPVPPNRKPESILLIGPGRWGTTTPTLGVPVCFAEINTVSVICELVMMREGLRPEVSLGTHFFSNLVESDILYFAWFPEEEGSLFNREYLLSLPNHLTEVLPSESKHANCVRWIDFTRVSAQTSHSQSDQKGIPWLYANCLTQSVLCYLVNNR